MIRCVLGTLLLLISSKVFAQCGTGTFNYLNCGGKTITIDRANLTPNTYIATDFSSAGWPHTLSYVNNSCSVGNCILVNCATEHQSVPIPSAGYPYGTVHFTPANYIAAGITELQAERINWIYCNMAGYSDTHVAFSIWQVMGNSFYNYALANNAIASVPVVVGGIASQMTFWIPDNPAIQTMVQQGCFAPCNAAVPTTTGASRCGTGSVTLNASGCSGGTLNWYTASTGGTWLGTGSTYTTASLSSSVTYYVDCTVGSCTSARSSATATVNSTPAISISKSNDLSCPTPTATLTASPSTGVSYLWDDGSTNSTRIVSAAGTYSLTVIDTTNGCSASANVTVISTISVPPCVPITIQKTN